MRHGWYKSSIATIKNRENKRQFGNCSYVFYNVSKVLKVNGVIVQVSYDGRADLFKGRIEQVFPVAKNESPKIKSFLAAFKNKRV